MASRPMTFQEALDAYLAEARAVMIERQRKYGPENIRALGLRGVLDRVRNDKLERISRVVERQDLRRRCLDAGMPREIVDQYLPELQADFSDESLRDAIIDVVNYGLIMLMLLDGVWGLPLAGE